LAATLVVGDTNASNDVFVRDRAAGSTTRVSVDSLGNQSAGWCYPASISGDGNRVQFHSEGTDLVPNDTNGQIDCFVHELSSGATWRVNVDSAGLPANNGSIGGAMSGDGRYVAFNSSASNLVPNDTNAAPDIFVRDLEPLACGSGAFYCTQSPSSQGCRAQLSTSGVCSASAGSGFVIQADAIDANRQGLFFYSTNGAQVASFNGGKLCAVPPLKRTQQLNSGGSGACGGTFALDFNARIASGVDPALVAGAQFWGQFWYRDPPNVWTTGTTHAVTAILCP
jgi:Tol biopolymer transport system component